MELQTPNTYHFLCGKDDNCESTKSKLLRTNKNLTI